VENYNKADCKNIRSRGDVKLFGVRMGSNDKVTRRLIRFFEFHDRRKYADVMRRAPCCGYEVLIGLKV
jgi:hypothetical protein